MRGIIFIALQDARHQLRQGVTIVWVFVMPPIFFYFIGTVTSGFSGGLGEADDTPIGVSAESPGFLKEQIDLRLRDNGFAPVWYETSGMADQAGAAPSRTLSFGAALTERIGDEDEAAVPAVYETGATALTRDYEILRIQRSLYTALADIVVADSLSAAPLAAADLAALNAEARIWQLDVTPAGQRREVPSGFEQAIPGMLVMFTILVLLTTGATSLAVERNQGLLRRLASAPFTRTELVAGKWSARMMLATVQVAVALAFGTWLFDMHWGPDFGMVVVVLAAWAAFCASAGLLLGSLARTEAQAVGLGLLIANALAALGGCWWPIEITPDWMQSVQMLTPTGWTMDALHKLISFEAGAVAAVPNVVTLVLGALAVGALAVNRFRYQ